MLTLKYPIGAGDTVLEFNEPVAALCAVLAQPAHAFMSIYSPRGNETVLATKCSGNKVHVLRGMDGTEARSWAACACVSEIRTEPGTWCDDAEHPDNQCCECLDGITATDSFSLTYAECGVVIALRPTGVVAGEFCGARVNEFGQFTFIPQGWPYNCLPAFNPCGPCEGAASGCGDSGAGSCGECGYSPRAGACVAVGDTVQVAIEQLDAALCSLQLAQGGGVLAVLEGSGIVISGTASQPVISLEPTGVGAGNYNGFVLNQYGQVVSYSTPPAAPDVVVAGLAPVSVAYSMGTKTYTVSVDEASSTDLGVVLVADSSEATGYTPSSSTAGVVGPKVATIEDVYSMVQQATLNANSASFNIDTLVAETGIPNGTSHYLVFYDGAHKKIARDDAVRSLGGAFARGVFSPTIPGLVDSTNVDTAVQISATAVRVTLLAPGIAGEYHVSVTPKGTVPQAVAWDRISATIFDVHFATAVAAFSFAVTET